MNLDKVSQLVTRLRKQPSVATSATSDLALLTQKTDQAFFAALLLVCGGAVCAMRHESPYLFIAVALFAAAIGILATSYRQRMAARDWLLSHQRVNLRD